MSTVPRDAVVPRKPARLFVVGTAHERTIGDEDYSRHKKRLTAINKWRAENLTGDIPSCSCCGWSAPAPFRFSGRQRNLTFLSIHHLTPYSEGGSEDDSNLLALCATCHKIADHLPRVVSLPKDETLKNCVKDHLTLLALDPSEWERQHERWNALTKRRAIESLEDQSVVIHEPFYVFLSFALPASDEEAEKTSDLS